MKKYVDCHKVELRECEYGLGVFASQNISCGEMIENGITQPLVDVDGNKTGNEHLHTWSDDRKVWASSSGCLAWYNHSDTPNVKKIANLNKNTLCVVALRNISAGEELRCTYSSAKWRACFKNKLQ